MQYAQKNGRFFGKIAINLSLCVIFAVQVFVFNIIDASASFTPSIDKIYSDGVYMVNLDTEIPVFEKNKDKAMPPASTTKIMTAIIVLENVKDLDSKVKIGTLATDEFWGDDPNKRNPSTAALEPGQDNISYRDCLYALMVASGCEAANVLAFNVSGSISAFTDLMNKKAHELGCINTHFSDAHGLYEKENYSCAYDMYLISRYAYDKLPEFMKIAETTSYDFPPNKANPKGYTLRTTNLLMRDYAENPYYMPEVKGIKTGSLPYLIDKDTKEKIPNTEGMIDGVSCLVSTAAKDGFTYMLVTLGAPYHDLETGTKTRPYSFDDHVALYNWAFDKLEYQQVLSQNDIVGSVKVLQGKNSDVVQLKPATDFNTLLPKDIDKSAVQRVINKFSDEVTAPVKEGDILGKLELKLEGKDLASVDLVSAENIERSQSAYLADKIKGVFSQVWFKLGVGLIVVLVVAVVILRTINNAKKAKRNRKKW
jgi:D-alanyl-D-alanine carboxypeptidase (penicillin-binding protein 5/6)